MQNKGLFCSTCLVENLMRVCFTCSHPLPQPRKGYLQELNFVTFKNSSSKVPLWTSLGIWFPEVLMLHLTDRSIWQKMPHFILKTVLRTNLTIVKERRDSIQFSRRKRRVFGICCFFYLIFPYLSFHFLMPMPSDGKGNGNPLQGSCLGEIYWAEAGGL